MPILLDTQTGELLQMGQLPENDVQTPLWYEEVTIIRETILKSLRSEVREFANFVLQFRNHRRGIFPGITQLASWYGKLHGKRPDNVRRLVNQLIKSGLLENETLVGQYFQFAGQGKPASYHKGEETRAAVQLASIEGKLKASIHSHNASTVSVEPSLTHPLRGIADTFRPRLYRPDAVAHKAAVASLACQ